MDDFFIRSACGRWQICRTGERGSCHERFSLWRRSPESGATQLIAVQRSADEARAIAAKEQAGTLEH